MPGLTISGLVAELVVALWFVPQMVPNSRGAEVAKAMLQNYVVVVGAHGRLQSATGTMSFENVDALPAMDQSGKSLTPVARDSLPPTNAGMLTALESSSQQTLGAMGNGMKMFVFDAGDVGSCKRGQLFSSIRRRNLYVGHAVSRLPTKPILKSWFSANASAGPYLM
jgi:hypothetical protein